MIEFTLIIFIAVAALAIRAFYVNGWAWRKTRVGQGMLWGLVIAPLAALLIGSLGGCARIDVFAGLESTKNLSPQCETSGASDSITSNLGVEACRTVSADRRTELCGVYRHHSCAISPDRESYDGVGFLVKRRVY
jgi:hypothetical protein